MHVRVHLHPVHACRAPLQGAVVRESSELALEGLVQRVPEFLLGARDRVEEEYGSSLLVPVDIGRVFQLELRSDPVAESLEGLASNELPTLLPNLTHHGLDTILALVPLTAEGIEIRLEKGCERTRSCILLR